MKKIFSVFLIFVLLVSVLTGCSGNGGIGGIGGDGNGSAVLPEGMLGVDAAKLLLANERLDAQLLKNEGDIFENGAQVMRNLSRIAKDNLSIPYVRTNGQSFSYENTSKETISTPDTRGKLEKDENNFYWSEFDEYNNSYSYFENITGNIVTSAEVAADLIDSIKKNVRVVDKWVKIGDHVKNYLHVEENSELLIEHYTADGLDLLSICVRYRNSEGKDVYELYRRSVTESYEERMTYIPGERYELSMKHGLNGGEDTNIFVAENTKGYWENYVLGAYADHNNVSYFIMKDGLCYDALYNSSTGAIPHIKVMSADRATDIFDIENDDALILNLKFSGFDGIKNVEAKISDVEYNASHAYANVTHGEVATVHFENGKSAKYGDEFLDGKVRIRDIYVGSYAGDVYAGSMYLNIAGENRNEQFATFRQFMEEFGLSCRRDVDAVLEGALLAFEDVETIVQYYKLNGVSVTDDAGIAEAVALEMERFAAMLVHYDAVKNAAVVDISDIGQMELSIHFAAISASSFEGAVLDAMEMSIDNVSLSVDDTLLFVKDEPYHVAFALANAEGGLVHLDMEPTSSVKYADEDTFTVTASAAQFTIPTLAVGDYTLVAYIATSEGIRSSAYTPVAIAEIRNMPVDMGHISASAAKNANGALVLSYAEKMDFTVTLSSETALDYATFKAELSALAFEYGTPTEVIERVDGEIYTPLAGDETEIANGTYRISYYVEKGGIKEQGYIYVEYSVS